MKRSPDRTRFPLAVARLGVLLALGICGVLWLTGDQWWGSFALLFGPRWSTALLMALPLPLLAVQPRRGIGYVLLTGGIVTVGLMGFRVGPARLWPSGPAHLRALTFNVASKAPVRDRLLAHLEGLEVDLALVVECPGNVERSIPHGWHARTEGELCLFSRYPITSWAPFPKSTSLARATIEVRGQAIDIGLLHLTSPRDALTSFIRRVPLGELRDIVDRNSDERRWKAMRAVEYLEPTGRPMIVGSDFNLPPESTLYWRHFRRFRDAFEQAGFGFGYTWRSSWHGLRIDHLLLHGGVRAVRTWVGPDLGSDHLPVIADLRLPLEPPPE